MGEYPWHDLPVTCGETKKLGNGPFDFALVQIPIRPIHQYLPATLALTMNSTTTLNSSIIDSWPCLKPDGPTLSGNIQEISLPPPSRPSQRSLVSAPSLYNLSVPPSSFHTDARRTNPEALLAVDLTGPSQMTQDLVRFPEQGADALEPVSLSEPFGREVDARALDQRRMDAEDGADAYEVKHMRKHRYLGAPLTVVSSGP